jgi:transposase
MEWLIPDRMVARVHPCAVSANKDGGQPSQVLGRSRGGFSTKIHVVADALGNPLGFALTPGQVHGLTQAETPLSGRRCDYVIADKGYDADAFLQLMDDLGAIPMVPAGKGHTQSRHYDKHLYGARYRVECFINTIKWFRRVCSRFEKLAGHYLGFLAFVATLIRMR